MERLLRCANTEALAKHEREVDKIETVVEEMEERLEVLIDQFQSDVDDIVNDYPDYDFKTHAKDYVGSSI